MKFLQKVKSVELKNFDVRTLNYKKYLAEIFLILGIVICLFATHFSSRSYATEEFWGLNIGDETVAYFHSESEVNQVIDKVKNKYVKKGASDVAVSVDPAMTAEYKLLEVDQAPKINTVDETVEYILTGTQEPVTYTVKKDDSLWSIAQDNHITVEELKEMNEDNDIRIIKPGDKLNLYVTKPFVNVTTTQTVTSTKAIKFKTKYIKTDALLLNTTKVKTEGKNGKKKVTETLQMVNGTVVKTKVISSKVIKKPVTKIVRKGTGTSQTADVNSSYSDGSTYSGSGSVIANFALQFVGNPYSYGGTSLTNGADCSGFVMAVYAHFGVSLPHDAGAVRSYGRGVSVSEAQPGDLICYYGHVGIYIGGGQIVHAKDYGYGICVDGLGYSGKSIMTVRRIVE